MNLGPKASVVLPDPDKRRDSGAWGLTALAPGNLLNPEGSVVGQCGLEPQTSTVSILSLVWEQMRSSEYKLYRCNA